MQPDQHPAPDYSFLNETGKPGKHSFFSGGDKKQSRLMMIAVGGIVLVVLLAIVALVFGGGNSNTARLTDLIAQQNEIIRIAELGEKDASAAETKNYASTVNLSMISAETQLSDYVEKQGRKIKSGDENAAKNEDTDAALKTAAQVNNFDTVFKTTLKSSLEKYRDSIRTAYDNAASSSDKNILQDLFKKAGILIETVPAD